MADPKKQGTIYEALTRLVFAGPTGRETVERGQLVELGDADAAAALKANAVKLAKS